MTVDGFYFSFMFYTFIYLSKCPIYPSTLKLDTPTTILPGGWFTSHFENLWDLMWRDLGDALNEKIQLQSFSTN